MNGSGEIAIGASSGYCLSLSVLYLLAGLGICHAALPALLSVALMFALFTGWVQGMHLEGLRWAGDAIAGIAWLETGWQLHLRDGRWLGARLLPDAVLMGSLLVMRFRLDSGSLRVLALLPDNLDKDDFRRLRVQVNLQCNAVEEH